MPLIPYLPFDCIQRLGKFGLEKVVRDLTERLLLAPPVHPLCPGAPKLNNALHVHCHDRVVGELDKIGLAGLAL